MIFRPDTFIAWWILRSIRIPRIVLFVFAVVMLACDANITYRVLIEISAVG
jgi:hypothetical protein